MKKGLSPAVAIEGVAAVALGVAALAVWLGGWHTEFLGVSLSVRAVSRPLFLVAALLALRWFLTPRVDRRRHFADAGARVFTGAIVTAGVLAWTTFVSPHLGGADSYGYVSASERLRAGTLIQPEPLASVLPYPDAIFPATPLGYVPAARQPGASVPAYPLGLPALMALATEIAGPRAPFYVALVMGLVLMATCYGMVYRWTREPVIALAASGALAFHPVVFAYAIQAMSDVPATALFLLAAACLMSERPGLAFLGGLAGALAFITRPALFPGTAALALIAIISGRNSTRRVTGFAAALAIGVVVQLSLQWYLYGHPLGNGYGGASDLFSFGHLPTNVRSYAYWSVAMHGSFWLVAFVLGLWLHRDASAYALLAAASVAAVIPYAIYRPYDHWETLRFILPLLVVSTLVAIVGLFKGARRSAGPHAGTVAGDRVHARLRRAVGSLARSAPGPDARTRGRALRPGGRARGSRDAGSRRDHGVAPLRQSPLLREAANARLGQDSAGAVRENGDRARGRGHAGVSHARWRGRGDRVRAPPRTGDRRSCLAAGRAAARHQAVRSPCTLTAGSPTSALRASVGCRIAARCARRCRFAASPLQVARRSARGRIRVIPRAERRAT